MNDKVVVKESLTHGKGIFAHKDIKKGECVMQWDVSHEISGEVEKLLSSEEKTYISELNGRFIKMQAPECYLNHSCEPNTSTIEFADVAIKDIGKGEEVTGNYNEVVSIGPVIDCNCGSSKCKGKIFTQ